MLSPDSSIWDDSPELEPQPDDCHEDEPHDTMTDVEADADTLASAGWGTDEDYGDFGPEEY